MWLYIGLVAFVLVGRYLTANDAVYDGGYLPTLDITPTNSDVMEISYKGTALPAGIRNNNPLNVMYDGVSIWNGADGVANNFITFSSFVWGVRCALYLLRKYIKVYQLRTIPQIVNRWAPVGHGNNNPVLYANHVSLWSGIPITAQLDADDMEQMSRLVRAMCRQENGNGYENYITGDIIQAAWIRL
jgi:hypothetical protein